MASLHYERNKKSWQKTGYAPQDRWDEKHPGYFTRIGVALVTDKEADVIEFWKAQKNKHDFFVSLVRRAIEEQKQYH